MKKVDWLIAAFFMVMGIMCLTVSASYYRTDSSSGGLGIFKPVCIWMAIIGVVIYLGYQIVRFKQRKRKKK